MRTEDCIHCALPYSPDASMVAMESGLPGQESLAPDLPNACWGNVMSSIAMRMCAIGAFVVLLHDLPASAQTLEPYQATASIGDSTTCPSAQCILSFPAVPRGKRLVVESVSAQLGPASNQLVLEGGGVTYFVPKSHPDLGYLAAPVTVYYDAGSTPTARIFAPSTTQRTSLIVTLVGRLVPQ
jgi:hypothetical protein